MRSHSLLRIGLTVVVLCTTGPATFAQRSHFQTREPILTHDDLAVLLTRLKPQMAPVVEALYDEFAHEHDQEWSAVAEEIRQLTLPEHPDATAAAESDIKIRRSIEQWNRERRELFTAFVNDVRAVIEAEALGAWDEAVRSARYRDWTREIDPSGRNLDLIDPFSYLDTVELNPVESEQISAFREQYTEAMERAIERLELEFDPLATSLTEATLRDAPDQAELRKRYRTIVDEIVAINARFRDRIASALAPENRSLFAHGRESDALPQLYRVTPMDLAVEELRGMNLHPDVISRVEILYESYLRRRDALRRKVLAACYEWTTPEMRASVDAEMDRLRAEYEAGSKTPPLEAKRAHSAIPFLYELLEVEERACRQVLAVVSREEHSADHPILDLILRWFEPLPNES